MLDPNGGAFLFIASAGEKLSKELRINIMPAWLPAVTICHNRAVILIIRWVANGIGELENVRESDLHFL